MADFQKPFLFGLFDQAAPITSRLRSGGMREIPQGNIFSNGYQKAERGNKLLYLCSRIYNLEEIKTLLDSKTEKEAELIFDLFEKEVGLKEDKV